ncbi:hypothetical protein KAX97_09065 [candidate division WOR-3 bacterium]|nr:hypothetical protein [candidate division WOR-3 bacterium]
MIISINTIEALQQAWLYYDEVTFDTNDITFNEKERKFSLKFTRIMYEKTILKKKFLIFEKVKVPKIISSINFRQVNKMELKADQPDDWMEYIIYNQSKHQIEFKCIKGTVIILMVEELNGTIIDIGEKFFDDNSEYWRLARKKRKK